jgi:short-subunit dehydrogenase
MDVFITGGTSGLGLALAELYYNNGHRVGLCGRDISKLPKESKAPERWRPYTADVLNKEQLAEAIHDFSKGHRLDLLIASAGRSVGKKSKIPNFSVAQQVIEVNIFGVLNCYELALPIMQSQGTGHLCAISSVAGFMGLPGASSYSASKAAITIFNESLTLDLKDSGINVSTICPGFVDTPLTRQNNHKMPFLMSSEKAAKVMKKGLDRKKSLIVYPWQMWIVVTFLSKIPRSWYRKLMGLKWLNYSG